MRNITISQIAVQALLEKIEKSIMHLKNFPQLGSLVGKNIRISFKVMRMDSI